MRRRLAHFLAFSPVSVREPNAKHGRRAKQQSPQRKPHLQPRKTQNQRQLSTKPRYQAHSPRANATNPATPPTGPGLPQLQRRCHCGRGKAEAVLTGQSETQPHTGNRRPRRRSTRRHARHAATKRTSNDGSARTFFSTPNPLSPTASPKLRDRTQILCMMGVHGVACIVSAQRRQTTPPGGAGETRDAEQTPRSLTRTTPGLGTCSTPHSPGPTQRQQPGMPPGTNQSRRDGNKRTGPGELVPDSQLKERGRRPGGAAWPRDGARPSIPPVRIPPDTTGRPTHTPGHWGPRTLGHLDRASHQTPTTSHMDLSGWRSCSCSPTKRR